ncbi:hypothetical protein AUJ83_00010 [Candidatus Woesearchaeota archaeon CG1_02_33_12]|nr:MAG: hypothetical protein AUJ83_00010 [Candidatus Woesearchaeota archaeon CG1_02_33_12]
MYFIVVGISFSKLVFSSEAMPCSKSSNDVELSASIVKEGSPWTVFSSRLNGDAIAIIKIVKIRHLDIAINTLESFLLFSCSFFSFSVENLTKVFLIRIMIIIIAGRHKYNAYGFLKYMIIDHLLLLYKKFQTT